MTTQNGDDDSFIILGSSPGTSLDMKYSGMENGDVALDKDQMEEAMKDLPVEANMAFKAHFKLGDCGPSPTSMMVASTIITEEQSTDELQKRFGELLDENVILKETLKQNNDSMKEQFMLIASCQEDMMKTHMLHKEKFDETKGLVEKLRLENKKLKQDISRFTETETQLHTSSENGEREAEKSGPSSALEFVTSPDDDTINKLTAQLELVEKQRRQVIVENEKLTWQKESLEHIVDATSKERDDLKEKLKNAELQLSTKDTEHADEINNFQFTIQNLQTEIERLSAPAASEEITKRDALIHQLEGRVATLMADLKAAQLRVFELEGVKLELTKVKSGESDIVKIYKEQIQELQIRLKDASTTVFQPVRFSVSAEPESSSEFATFTANVKLYDRTLKHLADVLNAMTHGASDSLVESLGLIVSLHDYKLDRSTAEQFKLGLTEIKQQIEKQHSAVLNNIGQVRSTLTIFEGIFRDYNELLKRSVSKPKVERSPVNVEALTAALVARGQELQSLETELAKLKEQKENTEIMKAQLDLYKADFEAERDSRAKMASEKETIMTDLRTTQRRNQELTKQLDEVRRINPTLYQLSASIASAPPPAPAAARPSPRVAAPAARSPASSGSPTSARSSTTTGNMVFTCPKCLRFSCDQYKVMEDHFDFCLDDF